MNIQTVIKTFDCSIIISKLFIYSIGTNKAQQSMFLLSLSQFNIASLKFFWYFNELMNESFYFKLNEYVNLAMDDQD